MQQPYSERKILFNSKFWKYLYWNDLLGSWNINKQSWNLGHSDIWQAANAGEHTTELARPIDVGATLPWLANIPAYIELHACAKHEINSAWSWILAQIHNNIFIAGPFSLFCDFHRKINTHVCWLFFGTLQRKHIADSGKSLWGKLSIWRANKILVQIIFFFGFFSEKEIRYDDGGAAACENGDELINNSDGYYLGWFSLFCGVCIRIILAEPIIKFLNKIKNFDPTSSIKNAYTVVIPKEVDFSHLARNLGYSGKLVLHRSGNCSALIALFCFIFSKIIGLTSQIFVVPIF